MNIMTAFLIATIEVLNPDKMQAYGQAAAPIIAEYGGRFVLKGAYKTSLVGEGTAHKIGIIEFPDIETLLDWYESDDYQSLISLRDEAAIMTFNIYEGPPS